MTRVRVSAFVVGFLTGCVFLVVVTAVKAVWL